MFITDATCAKAETRLAHIIGSYAKSTAPPAPAKLSDNECLAASIAIDGAIRDLVGTTARVHATRLTCELILANRWNLQVMAERLGVATRDATGVHFAALASVGPAQRRLEDGTADLACFAACRALETVLRPRRAPPREPSGGVRLAVFNFYGMPLTAVVDQHGNRWISKESLLNLIGIGIDQAFGVRRDWQAFGTRDGLEADLLCFHESLLPVCLWHLSDVDALRGTGTEAFATMHLDVRILLDQQRRHPRRMVSIGDALIKAGSLYAAGGEAPDGDEAYDCDWERALDDLIALGLVRDSGQRRGGQTVWVAVEQPTAAEHPSHHSITQSRDRAAFPPSPCLSDLTNPTIADAAINSTKNGGGTR